MEALPYFQVALLFIGVMFAVGHFGSNHTNRANGRSYYSWAHPRFLALALTIISTAWLLLWPCIVIFARDFGRGAVVMSVAIALNVLVAQWLNIQQRIALGVLTIPLMSLAVGGIPSDMSLTANLAILNMAPTLYILHHKGDDRLRDIFSRHDIRGAYAIWIVGHTLAYWSLFVTSLRIAGPMLLWAFVHVRVMALTVVGIMLVSAFGYLMHRAFRKYEVPVRRRTVSSKPADQQAPHFLE